MIGNSLKKEYRLDFQMRSDNDISFIGWKLVIGRDVVPFLLGKHWFDPMTGERKISQYAYTAKHMEDRDFGKPYEASLFWKISDFSVEKFQPSGFSISSPEKIFKQNCTQLSNSWRKCWLGMEQSYNAYALSCHLPYDSGFTNHILFLDEIFEEINPFKNSRK